MNTKVQLELLYKFSQFSTSGNTNNIGMTKALEIFESSDHQKIPYFHSLAEAFAEHYGIQNIVQSIDGSSKLISDYMVDSIQYDTESSGLSRSNSSVPISILAAADTYVVLPRADLHKAHSLFYPLIDLRKNGLKHVFEENRIEPFHRYQFDDFSVVGPKNGGTHRTVGLCLSYGLVSDAHFVPREYQIFDAVKNKMRPLADAMIAMDALDAKIEIRSHYDRKINLHLSRDEAEVTLVFKSAQDFIAHLDETGFIQALNVLLSSPFSVTINDSHRLIRLGSENISDTFVRESHELAGLRLLTESYEKARQDIAGAGWAKRWFNNRLALRRFNASVFKTPTSNWSELGAYMASKAS